MGDPLHSADASLIRNTTTTLCLTGPRGMLHYSQSTAGSGTPESASATSYASSQSGLDNPLGDLQKYIALGVLYPDPRFRQHIPSPISNTEWIEINEFHSFPEFLHDAVGRDTPKLLHNGWIKLFPHRELEIVRVYLLPGDVGRRFIDRASKSLKTALRELLLRIDISPEAWSGTASNVQKFDPWATAENASLFYLFNKLPSPASDTHVIKCPFTRRAVEEIFDASSPSPWEGYEPAHGLKTRLYPYQARSAALMIQRETAPQLQLDPRLEERVSPTGQTFYFSARDGSFLLEPRFYEANRGGILAESMGLGKTVICLAVILATRLHLPEIPPQYQRPTPVRERVGSLIDMIASVISRNSIPVKAHLRRLEEEEGINLGLCIDVLDRNVPNYEIPAEVPRMNRTTRIPPPKDVVMCSGTIIVVPRNLLHQWQSEIRKHIVKGSLKILIMDTKSKRRKKDPLLTEDESDGMEIRYELPSASDLLQYDIVLFSRTRFEQEIQDGADDAGRRFTTGPSLPCHCPYIGASRVPDCTCFHEGRVYESPLKKLHWLRIIIDEGHNFSSKNANAVLVARQLHAERRWVVSGTPAKDLVGVEVDLATMDNTEGDSSLLRESAIEQRKTFNTKDDSTGAAKSLGLLASNFLMVRPWCDSGVEGRLDWEDYIYRHEHPIRKTYSGFSTCFLRTLEGLVVKTRPEDVERDIVLPPMKHQVVYLKPCWYDKMTANLFIQVFRANAITSEREGVDYLFHKNSAQARHSMIRNLRQSNFTWTGFSIEDVAATLESSSKYLAKYDKTCSLEDANSLLESCQIVSSLLQSDGWTALSKSHEVGMFVEAWPEQAEEAFAFTYPNKPTMIGITQLLEGQAYVDGRILTEDPVNGLDVVGLAAKAKLAAIEETENNKKSGKDLKEPSQAGVPTSCVAQPLTSRRATVAVSKSSPAKRRATVSKSTNGDDTNDPDSIIMSPSKPRKRRATEAEVTAELPSSSPLRNTRVVGTTSSKLSYLIKKVIEHQDKEKIIIFYDGDNAAFYIAQCLEMLYVNHRIYARTLDNPTRSKYVALFNEDPDIRVLLIDVACGALGLNLNVASVVLIVNPINRPGVEAQAIKRAHRIGQTREVLVETLVLEGTIEEAIFNQAKQMSRKEHLEAKTLEDADKIMSIIQNAKIIPVAPEEASGTAQFAPLEIPQQVFARLGRAKYQAYGHLNAVVEKPSKRARSEVPKKTRLEALVDKALDFSQTKQESLAPDVPSLSLPTVPSLFG